VPNNEPREVVQNNQYVQSLGVNTNLGEIGLPLRHESLGEEEGM
jgi:hypothetical protein